MAVNLIMANDNVTEEHRTALMETSQRAHRLLARAIRREDQRSLGVIQRRLQAVDLDPHRAEWERVGEQARNNLAGRLYPRALLDAVIRAAGE